MNKESRERKINRDKKDKKIRHNLDYNNHSFERQKVDYSHIYNNFNYQEINKTKHLLNGINTKGMKLNLSNKNDNIEQQKYNKPYKFDLYFSNLTNKKDKLYANRGHNKGNTKRSKGANNIYGSHFAKQDCKSDEFSLVYNYKDRSPKEVIFDPDKPICVVCYDRNSGMGRYLFKKCKHGTDLCIGCARKLLNCPICRKERR